MPAFCFDVFFHFIYISGESFNQRAQILVTSKSYHVNLMLTVTSTTRERQYKDFCYECMNMY